MYSTKTLTDEYRTVKMNGQRFDVCEHCGYDASVKGTAYNSTYYYAYDKVLCDRCIDKSNYPDKNYWSDPDAKESGFPVPFPSPTPEKVNNNINKLKEYKTNKRGKNMEHKLMEHLDSYRNMTKEELALEMITLKRMDNGEDTKQNELSRLMYDCAKAELDLRFDDFI